MTGFRAIGQTSLTSKVFRIATYIPNYPPPPFFLVPLAFSLRLGEAQASLLLPMPLQSYWLRKSW